MDGLTPKLIGRSGGGKDGSGKFRPISVVSIRPEMGKVMGL